MPRFPNILRKHPFLFWGPLAALGYLILLYLTFYWSVNDRIHGKDYRVLWSAKAASFQPDGDGYAGSHEMDLESLDPRTGELRIGYTLSDSAASDSLHACPWFGHEAVDLGSTSGWVEETGFALTPIPGAASAPAGGERKYQGQFTIHPDIEPNRFPFDKIVVEIHYTDGVLAGCRTRPDARLRPPRMLNVENRIPGFIVDSRGLEISHRSDEDTYMRLQLVRSRFLRSLALLVGALAAISTGLLARAIWRRQAKDWSPLAYFVGLWGGRDIFLSLIPDPRPFPTLVDVSALYLFGIILATWVLASLRGR